ncbi:MAG: hypothetical protein LUG91_00095 [Ruminococcus sp.]|nr:hypothetical protein [Ruminococcus sp.]
MYNMTLADGTVVKFADMNGTNYITKDQTEIDTSVFTDENLKSGSIVHTTGDKETIEFENWAFIQQQKQPDGDYYIAFRQKSSQELADELRDAYITALEEALIELYESTL